MLLVLRIGGGVCLSASSFGATVTPTSAADDVTRNVRRDFVLDFRFPALTVAS